MKTNHQQIYQILVFVSCLLSASWTQAATVFNLSFFDENNAQVGQGQFSVDIGARRVFFSGSPPQDPSDPPALIAVSPLTGFSVNIQGLSLGLENLTTLEINMGSEFTEAFWEGALSSVGVYRMAGSRPLSGWVFSGSNNQLYMVGLGGAVSGSGDWFQAKLAFEPFRKGTWVATATPIPAAVWLFASGLGALGVFRRKRLVNK